MLSSRVNLRGFKEIHVIKLVSAAIALTLSTTAWLDADQETGKWGDQGDGTYRNPVIAADYSDPDPLRVGNDYYMVASTFEMSPGVSILHSIDMVNWESLGGAIPDVSQLGPNFNWDQTSRRGMKRVTGRLASPIT